jgi:hypothetical protein
MTSALEDGGWLAPLRGLFTPGKDPVPIAQEAGWAPWSVWTCAKNLAPTGIRSQDRPVRSQSTYEMRLFILWNNNIGWGIRIFRDSISAERSEYVAVNKTSYTLTAVATVHSTGDLSWRLCYACALQGKGFNARISSFSLIRVTGIRESKGQAVSVLLPACAPRPADTWGIQLLKTTTFLVWQLSALKHQCNSYLKIH